MFRYTWSSFWRLSNFEKTKMSENDGSSITTRREYFKLIVEGDLNSKVNLPTSSKADLGRGATSYRLSRLISSMISQSRCISKFPLSFFRLFLFAYLLRQFSHINLI